MNAAVLGLYYIMRGGPTCYVSCNGKEGLWWFTRWAWECTSINIPVSLFRQCWLCSKQGL